MAYVKGKDFEVDRKHQMGGTYDSFDSRYDLSVDHSDPFSDFSYKLRQNVALA